MHLTHGFWTSLTYVVNFFSLSPISRPSIKDQAPLAVYQVESQPTQGTSQSSDNVPPLVFQPPGSDDPTFFCDYQSMPRWEYCSTPENRTCWIRNHDTNETYDIWTNYEDINKTPTGTNRTYEFDVTDDKTINLDGVDFPYAKLFDRKYPGPWLQACWGDQVTIKINNWMKLNGGNGTSIHWHGIRQWNTMHMDGVNGLTECPIAPGDSFTYSWRVMQYGSSWYHSHFSVQYADGLAGPMTLHGPTFLPYDEAVRPIMISDWGHNSAFDAIQTRNFEHPSIIVNGIGNAHRYNNKLTPNDGGAPPPYSAKFSSSPIDGRPRRYLMRIINTSFASSFIFSIDGHKLQVVGADFVPIQNFTTESVLIAIGQRYHVIVEAVAPPPPGKQVGSFWIRTWEAGCTNWPAPHTDGYEKNGYIEYDGYGVTPNSTEWKVDQTCKDEDYDHLKPVLKWEVGEPVNGDKVVGQILNIRFRAQPEIYPLAKAAMNEDPNKFSPLYVNYGDPTFLHLNYTGEWDPLWVVIPEEVPADSWVYFVITGANHPIHLHGHDYAILEQKAGPFVKEAVNLKKSNPPRRDVVMIPDDGKGNGYVVIAFKADNPGTWLMHCHIAFHASFGLAVQILERQKKAIEIWPDFEHSHALRETQRVCNNWNKWWGDCRDWWPGDGKSCGIGAEGFAPDSGI